MPSQPTTNNMEEWFWHWRQWWALRTFFNKQKKLYNSHFFFILLVNGFVNKQMDTKFSNHSENIRELLHIPGTCIFRTYTDTPNLMHSLHVYTVAADYIYCITFKKNHNSQQFKPCYRNKTKRIQYFLQISIYYTILIDY